MDGAVNLADRIHDTTTRVARIECDLLEQMIAAFVVETGQPPAICNALVAGRQWIQANPNGDVTMFAGLGTRLTEFAAGYNAKTDVPASEAVLVREMDGTMFSWRFERRVT